MEKNVHLMVNICCRETGISRAHFSVIGLKRPVKTKFLISEQPFIDDARNKSVQQFLETDCTHLIMIDDDHFFVPSQNNAILKLLEDDLPIVSGLYYNRGPPYFPIILKIHSQERGMPKFEYPYKTEAEIPKQRLIETDATGAGCLMIERSVFENIKPPWFLKTIWAGEDVFFCTPEGIIYGDFHEISNAKDFALTHMGKIEKIEKTFRRPYNGQIINIESSYCEPIKLTPEHQVYCTHGWKEAINICETDYLFCPRPQIKHHDYSLDMSPYSNGAKEVENGFKFVRTTKKSAIIPKTIKLNEDTAWLLAIYTAEGSACGDKNHVSFSFNINEKEYIKQTQRILRDYFGIKRITKTIVGNCMRLTVTSKILNCFFTNEFGKKSSERRLPNWLTENGNYSKSVIKGLFDGDGCYNCDRVPSFTSSSRILAHQFRNLLLYNGIFAGIKKPIPKDNYTRYIVIVPARWRRRFGKLIGRDFPDALNLNHYKTIIESTSGWWIPIKRITKEHYIGDVFNIDVQKDNSYVLNGIAVHNCVKARNHGYKVMIDTTVTPLHFITDVVGPLNCIKEYYEIVHKTKLESITPREWKVENVNNT